MNIKILSLLFVISLNSFGQCNVHQEKAGDDLVLHSNSKERIFQNEDLENGIQNIFINLACMKSSAQVRPIDRELLFKWWLFVDSGADSNKPKVTPRMVTIGFSDYTEIVLTAKYLEDPRLVYSVTMQEGLVKLEPDEFEKIRTKEISKIIITNTRESLSIICRPYKGILKEQANCLVTEVGF